MPTSLGRYSRVGGASQTGRASRTGDVIPDPDPEVDAEITVTATQIRVSETEPAVTWINSGPVTFDQPGWPNVMTNGRTMYGAQSLHIYPFGLTDPWSAYTSVPSNPAPTSGITLGTTSQSWLFRGALTDMENFSASGNKHVKLYGAPWWMKHRVANNGTVTDMTSADMYSDEGRVKYSRLPDWIALVKAVARVSMDNPFTVYWYSVWNELKGYFDGGVWNVSMNSGIGDTPMGYSFFYQQTSQAVLEVADELGIPRTNIKIGGPYNVLRGRSTTASAVSASNPYAQYLYNRPWGYMDQNDYLAIKSFLDHVVAQSLRFDFMSVDGSDYNRPLSGNPPDPSGWPATDDWNNGLRWHDWHQWLYAEMAARGLTNRTITWEEYYRFAVKIIYPNGTTRDNYDAALCSDFFRWCVLDGVKWPMAWGPYSITMNGSRIPAQLTSGSTAAGGQLTAYGNATALFKTHFSPGTSIRSSSSNSSNVLTLANPTHCLLISKINASQTFRINGGTIQTLGPYEVAAISY